MKCFLFSTAWTHVYVTIPIYWFLAFHAKVMLFSLTWMDTTRIIFFFMISSNRRFPAVIFTSSQALPFIQQMSLKLENQQNWAYHLSYPYDLHLHRPRWESNRVVGVGGPNRPSAANNLLRDYNLKSLRLNSLCSFSLNLRCIFSLV